MSRKRERAVALALSIALLMACSGGGPQTAGIDGSGARSPVVTQGPIQGFGSVVVNSVHYSVASAEISVDGAAASESALAVGQIVRIRGSIDAARSDAVADTVEFYVNVEGPVQAVDPVAGTLVVLGQRVTTDADTVFDTGTADAGFAAFAVGHFAKVSGLVAPGGTIRATWIARDATPPPEFRVVGTVAALDAALYRFNINDLVVDYSRAGAIDGFQSGALQNGDTVRVEGASLAPSGELVADAVARFTRELGEHEGDGAEIEGLITRFASPTDFDVSGLPVRTDASTAYEGGSAADLALDVKIQVQGAVGADGVILARKIEIKDGGSIGDE